MKLIILFGRFLQLLKRTAHQYSLLYRNSHFTELCVILKVFFSQMQDVVTTNVAAEFQHNHSNNSNWFITHILSRLDIFHLGTVERFAEVQQTTSLLTGLQQQPGVHDWQRISIGRHSNKTRALGTLAIPPTAGQYLSAQRCAVSFIFLQTETKKPHFAQEKISCSNNDPFLG